MGSGGDEQVECSHCGTDVPLDEASLLNKINSKGLYRYLCSDCLKNLHVPAGYELKRDVSFLRRGGSPAEVRGDGEEPVQAGEQVTERRERPSASSVIADFMGQVVTEETPGGQLTHGRILMDRRKLVMATDEHRTTVRFEAIQDVVPHGTSESARDDAAEILTIAYRSGGSDRMAFVGAPPQTLDRFMRVLVKALIGGTSLRYKHPAGGDGSPHEPPVRSGTLRVRDGCLKLTGSDRPVTIELERVTDVSTVENGWPESDEPVLEIVQQQGAGESVSELGLSTVRQRRLLRRFARTAIGD